MKYLKKHIPFEIIVWSLQHYYTNKNTIVDIPKIPKYITENSIEYLKKEFNWNGKLYRGLYNLKSNEILNIKNNKNILQKSPSSWSFDEETAGAFAKDILMTINYNNYSLISIDYILDNVTDKQKEDLKKIIYEDYSLYDTLDFYLSESEIVIFEDILVPIGQIEFI